MNHTADTPQQAKYRQWIENQKALIISAVMTQDSLYKVLSAPPDIFTGDYSKLHTILKELDEENIQPDLITIRARLKFSEVTVKDETLMELYETASTVNIDYLIEWCKLYNKERRLRSAAADIFNLIEKGTTPSIDMLTEQLTELVNSISEDSEAALCGTISTYISDPFLDKDVTYYSTGLKTLDNIITGWNAGDLVTIAARPGMGKSAFALQSVMDKNFLYFSLEMPSPQLANRLVSMKTGIFSSKLRAGKLTEPEKHRVKKAAAEIAENCHVIPIDNLFSISEILPFIKQKVKKENCQGVVIDYLGLLSGGEGQTENLRLGSISKSLKRLAVSLDIPVIVLHQLNRESEKHSREPSLHDLRESGRIEEDADIVMFIHAEVDWRHESMMPCKFIISKHRHGSTGVLSNLTFDKVHFRFLENSKIENMFND